MLNCIVASLKRIPSNKKGSVTLEASIIFPTIMLILFGLIFFSMFIYEKLVALDTAIYTSTQRAVTWDNSYKDLETGSLGGKLKNDGLYWRLFNDADNSKLALGKNLEAYGLAGDGLGAGVFHGSDDMDISYDNQVLQRLVSVSVKEKVNLPVFVGSGFGPNVSAHAVSVVAEPVEYIRTLDLLNYYRQNLNSYLDRFRSRQDTGSKVYLTKNEYYEKVYHSDPSCRYVKRISKNGNLKILESEADAKDLEYRICKYCSGEAGRRK